MSGQVLFSVIVIIFCTINNKVYAVMELDTDSDRFPFDRKLHQDVLDPDLCQRQLTHLTTDTGLLARFLDSGIRVPRGILMGNTVDLGNFRQCLAINEEAEDMAISGKYCRISVPAEQSLRLPEYLDRSPMKFNPSELQIDKNMIRQLEAVGRQKAALRFAGADFDKRIGPDSPLANVNFDLAICIPRPCSTEQAVNGLLFNLTNIGFEYSKVSCRLPDDRPWVAADYVASVIFGTIGLLTVISTCYDLYQSIYLKKGSKDISTAYTSFSVYTNTRRLLTFNSSPGTMECLDGVRTLAMIWVILGHSFSGLTETTNPIDSFQWAISPQGIWITVAPLTVDTFFLLSGLLLVFTTVGKLSPMQLLKKLHLFYLHRLLRMFPILAAIILYHSSLYMRISDGPLWDIVAFQVFRCRKFWWSTLLHVQNIVNNQQMCIGVAWYLAIDIQLHILSPIVLFWVLTSKRAAWWALNASLTVILAASTIFIFIKNFPSGVISPNRNIDDYLKYYYVNTLTRGSPFFVGMIYGYVIHLWKKKNIQIPKVLTTIILLCSLLTILVTMYCAHIAMQMDWDNQLADNFFNSFLRPLWALALGWIIFACIQGRAEPINWFLSLRIWKLPARLSYAMYLVHYSVIMPFYSAIITPVYFTVPSILFNFMAFMLTTIIISFFVMVVIDSPFSTIFKLLLGGSIKSQPSKVTASDNDLTKDKDTKDYCGFAADEDNKKLQHLNVTSENGDVKLNLNK